MDEENKPQVEVKPKLKKKPIAALQKPSVNPPTTVKLTKAMEKKREKLEEDRKKAEEKKKEEEGRKTKLQAVFYIY